MCRDRTMLHSETAFKMITNKETFEVILFQSNKKRRETGEKVSRLNYDTLGI